MSIYKVIKGAVTTKEGMVNEGGTMESSPEDAAHLIKNGFVELATPASAPPVETVVEDAPVEKPVVSAPPAAVKGKK
jgi:hypothetical protein